ncbi:hypothetical protein GCM10009646_19360 [Streptomyces aureus]
MADTEPFEDDLGEFDGLTRELAAVVDVAVRHLARDPETHRALPLEPGEGVAVRYAAATRGPEGAGRSDSGGTDEQGSSAYAPSVAF